MKVELYDHQVKALTELHDGCILRGGVGSGKSITSLVYFFTRVMGGSLTINGKGGDGAFQNPDIDTLLIITPAKKREALEWDYECSRFGLGKNPDHSRGRIKVIIDSWQNVQKYVNTERAFVIFDEQRLVGSGAWVKAFYKIAKNNRWILLSATPGDSWMDYIPVFVANGFYKNRTEFIDRHVVYANFSKFPKIKGYYEEAHLFKLSRSVLVEMPYIRHTHRNIRTLFIDYDKDRYQRVSKERWNVWEDLPIPTVAQLLHLLRRAVNASPGRCEAVKEIHAKHQRLIVFYNFTYELEELRESLTEAGVHYAEWNGQKHEEVPESDNWVYLVQYTAGADAWNCITTDAILFYSLQYSHKTFEQTQGRIDRINTPYTELWYYVLRSNSGVDQAIWKALMAKKDFNAKTFAKENGYDLAA